MYFKKQTEGTTETEALPLELCYAKTVQDEDGCISFGLPVLFHCIIVGEVARILVSHFSQAQRDSIFPSGVALVAACHDIGKINPLFMKKIYQSVSGPDVSNIPALQDARIEMEKETGHHSGVSQAFFEQDYPYVALIVGRHHGYNPQLTVLADDPIIGGKSWLVRRLQLLDQLKMHFQESFPTISSVFQASAVAGLVTVSDWIGSGTVFQNLKSIEIESIGRLVQEAVRKAGFIEPKIRKGLSFKEIFGFMPRETQQSFFEMVNRPGVYILEALMGEGKTEAALYGAYKMLENGFSKGIYFALPTKLTSEKMYERMQEFLDSVLDDDEAKKLYLLHGSSWLFETEFGEEGMVGQSWFDSSKRKILAPFAVGTLDQALLSVLNVKHGFVRSFGLAGKVVILDEIHSYDAYTGTLVQFLVKELEMLGCTVILLSATLTLSKKNEILGIGLDECCSNEPYPLITKKADEKLKSIAPKGPDENVCAVRCESSMEEVSEQVRQATLDGSQVLWIENTVGEAQSVFKQFAAWCGEVGVEIGLVHSRFPTQRRNELENYWVGLFGKQGTDQRAKMGRLLIGTQVLEQSLDIDADLLITKLAPTDMLLQRMGRLWRHPANNAVRPASSTKEMIILVPDIAEVECCPEIGFGPSGAIYAPYVLWRTYQEWKQQDRISIPSDIRPILERTYKEQGEAGAIARLKSEVEKKRSDLHRFALNGMALQGETRTESVSTRYSDIPTCPVLLITSQSHLRSFTIHLLDGSVVDVSPDNVTETKKKLTKQLMQMLIHVPYYIAPRVQTNKELSWIKPFLYISEDEKERIRLATIDESGSIRTMGNLDTNDIYDLFYTPVLGYVANKKMGDIW